MFPNPSNDIARIALKRRTSSSRTAVLLMGDSPRLFPASSFTENNKLCPNVDESVREGVSNGNTGKAVTTANGVGNNGGIADAASAKTSKALDNNVLVLKNKKCRDIYIAKRRAKRRARKKTSTATRKATDHTEQECTQKRKSHCIDGVGQHLPHRSPRECLPSQEEMLSLLVKALPFVPDSPEQKKFEKEFRDAVTDGSCSPDESKLCRTPFSYIVRALKQVCYPCPQLGQLSSLSQMFEENGVKLGSSKDSLREVYLMDVVLDRTACPRTCARGAGKSNSVDPDVVAPMKCYDSGERDDPLDYLFRTCLAFIPNAGIFYCARDRVHPDVGADKSLIPLPMSWLRLQRCYNPDGTPYYTFGDDSYVKGLFQDDGKLISVWKLGFLGLQPDDRRLIYRAGHCLDSNGPKMPPDVFSGEDAGTWPIEELKLLYNHKLAFSNSAREGGRHYATGCHHFNLPSTCWVLDPTIDPIIDVMIDVESSGNCLNMQTVLQVRHAVKLGKTQSSGCQKVQGWLQSITTCNSAIHEALSSPSVRNNTGDVGSMHALGTRVQNGDLVAVPFVTNDCVPHQTLRDMVVAMHEIGHLCFPDVLSVILSTEADSGLEPVEPMDGTAGKRVGFTIDTSVNLGNSSHFDVHDASQGFAVWTEEIPSMGSNWYFVMPNVHGKRPDGVQFFGLAVRLSHGAAISWDGRALRHCTSISMPDGQDGERVGKHRQNFKNNLFGTFTSAKQKILAAGKALKYNS
jgi:hypothetical protein